MKNLKNYIKIRKNHRKFDVEEGMLMDDFRAYIKSLGFEEIYTFDDFENGKNQYKEAFGNSLTIHSARTNKSYNICFERDEDDHQLRLTKITMIDFARQSSYNYAKKMNPDEFMMDIE